LYALLIDYIVITKFIYFAMRTDHARSLLILSILSPPKKSLMEYRG